MTRKLEEEFNLPHIDDMAHNADSEQSYDLAEIQTVEDAITISEKINSALAEVRGMEVHDLEMDTIALQAVESYEQLMSLGMNMTDMAAGPVFSNAAAMLKIALDAKDSKVNRKLKQIDLMLKKANLDSREKKQVPEEEYATAKVLDRNELLKMLKGE
jgi:hypothetical protein